MSDTTTPQTAPLGRRNEEWEAHWREGNTPWALKDVAPAMREVVEGGIIPADARVLIPGCGDGQDIIYLLKTSDSRQCVGLDVSSTALSVAQKNLESSGAPRAVERASFVSADFVTYAPSEKFDVVYDYTFFCAIPPSMRPSWGKQMGSLIKPGGKLICLMFPLSDDPPLSGPPFNVNAERYREVLVPNGFELVSMENPRESHPKRAGREKLAVWKKL